MAPKPTKTPTKPQGKDIRGFFGGSGGSSGKVAAPARAGVVVRYVHVVAVSRLADALRQNGSSESKAIEISTSSAFIDVRI